MAMQATGQGGARPVLRKIARHTFRMTLLFATAVALLYHVYKDRLGGLTYCSLSGEPRVWIASGLDDDTEALVRAHEAQHAKDLQDGCWTGMLRNFDRANKLEYEARASCATVPVLIGRFGLTPAQALERASAEPAHNTWLRMAFSEREIRQYTRAVCAAADYAQPAPAD